MTKYIDFALVGELVVHGDVHYEDLKRLPAAAVQEVRYGHWVGIDDFPHETWECNRCGRIIEGDRENYCPNCGALMVDEYD